MSELNLKTGTKENAVATIIVYSENVYTRRQGQPHRTRWSVQAFIMFHCLSQLFFKREYCNVHNIPPVNSSLKIPNEPFAHRLV
jgi:hypothetical protein